MKSKCFIVICASFFAISVIAQPKPDGWYSFRSSKGGDSPLSIGPPKGGERITEVNIPIWDLEKRNPLFIRLDIYSGNLWTGFLSSIPSYLVNHYIFNDYGRNEMRIRVASFDYEGQSMDYDGNNVFGFHAVDLFRDIEPSIKFGYQKATHVIGVYGRLGYRHENFQTKLKTNDTYSKHRIDWFRPSVGVEITPLSKMARVGKSWYPTIDVSGIYNYCIGYKGGHVNKDVINNGITSRYALSIKNGKGMKFSLSLDIDHFDLFNKDFKPNNGISQPYKDITSKRFCIGIDGFIPFCLR